MRMSVWRRVSPARNVLATAFLVIVCCRCCLTASTGSIPTNSNSNSNKRPASPTQPGDNKRHKVMEPAFVNAGTTAGLQVWRIEDFKPVAYPKDQYGKFYTGDSYIILSTKTNKRGDKSWDIHFWLGSETSQDESGAAAILSVQLDEQLGGAPVQYREVQEHESQLFLSHFKNGVRYLPGGVSSGFVHVDPNAFEKRLFQVKGKRNIRVKQVDASVSSMNRGDCFILDVGRTIYVYVGEKSKRVERLKAISSANQIRDQDHAGKARVLIIDEFSQPNEKDDFFEALGSGSPDSVPDESAGGDDQQFETSQEKQVSLYRVSDASGTLKVDLVAQKPLQQSQLDSNDCFILDTSDSNVFVWVGKRCNAKEKSEAMSRAQSFIASKNYPAWTNVQRIVEGAETTAFTQYFQAWRSTGELRGRLVRAASSDEDIEPRLFHAEIKTRGGKFEVEEIVDFEQRDLDDDDVMLLDIGKAVWVWIGSGASVEERTKARSLAELHLQKLQRDIVIPINTINQGEEPESFTRFFETWDPELWEKISTYSDVKHRVEASNEAVDF